MGARLALCAILLLVGCGGRVVVDEDDSAPESDAQPDACAALDVCACMESKECEVLHDPSMCFCPFDHCGTGTCYCGGAAVWGCVMRDR